MPEYNPNVFSEYLRARMGELSQQDLAALVGVSQQTVSKWLSGKVTPRPTMIGRLAAALGAPHDEMMSAAFPVEEQAPVLPYRTLEVLVPVLQTSVDTLERATHVVAAGGQIDPTDRELLARAVDSINAVLQDRRLEATLDAAMEWHVTSGTFDRAAADGRSEDFRTLLDAVRANFKELQETSRELGITAAPEQFAVAADQDEPGPVRRAGQRRHRPSPDPDPE